MVFGLEIAQKSPALYWLAVFQHSSVGYQLTLCSSVYGNGACSCLQVPISCKIRIALYSLEPPSIPFILL